MNDSSEFSVGVGKSHIIRVCSQWAEHILRRAGDKNGKLRVLLVCPTGMAASVIGEVVYFEWTCNKLTYHS